MGVAALTKPTTFQTFAKRVLGSQFVNQNNFLAALVLENAGDPTNAITPDFIGQTCVDTTNAHVYVAKAATSADWIQTA